MGLEEGIQLFQRRQAGAGAEAAAFKRGDGGSDAGAVGRRMAVGKRPGEGAVEGISRSGGIDDLDGEARADGPFGRPPLAQV